MKEWDYQVDCLVAKLINERDGTDYKVIAQPVNWEGAKEYIILLDGVNVKKTEVNKYSQVLDYFAPIWNR